MGILDQILVSFVVSLYIAGSSVITCYVYERFNNHSLKLRDIVLIIILLPVFIPGCVVIAITKIIILLLSGLKIISYNLFK